MSKEGSTEAPIRHPVDFNHPDFLDPKKLEQIIDKISNDEVPQPGSYRGRLSSEPENTRKTLIGNKNA